MAEVSLTNQDNFLLAPDGKFYRQQLIVSQIADQDVILASVSGTVPVDFPRVFTGSHGNTVGLQKKSANFFIYTELNEVKLNTVFWPMQNGQIIPVGSVSDGMTGTFKASFKWVIPKSQFRLFLVTMWAVTPSRSCGGFMASYVVMSDPIKKDFFRPPLPNLYADGKLCHGSYASINRDTMQEQFEDFFKHFNDSPWNADLAQHSGGIDKVSSVISFDADGKSMAPHNDWRSNVTRINNNNYSDLPIPN
jgi:hypothetical protein